MIKKKLVQQFVVEPGSRVDLKSYGTDWTETGEAKELGKDGTIRHVRSGVNPQGCQVFSFKKPSSGEPSHNFLSRSMKSLPERGRIGIFNRSYYRDVLVVNIHPE